MTIAHDVGKLSFCGSFDFLEKHLQSYFKKSSLFLLAGHS